MPFDTLRILENNIVILCPLTNAHYEPLYAIASDPVLWVHHPTSNGFTKDGFDKFFREALNSGSFVIIDKTKGNVIGTTRFYNYDASENSVVIGHTFLDKAYWGSGYNKSVKTLMFDYAFTCVNKVVFYVAQDNIRSQKALEKIGAIAKGHSTRNYEGKKIKCILFEVEQTTQ